ncbi:hypothetical protein BDN71DRAFT_1500672 [Pleurotus eryngii]|uniref:Uncharacterized protein n=1 Tax=Pleurotus eryngii TaxID=5323 RepID=A0A9P6A809_PLEER|nr:hypothetical protein BDN71DRAFT_1500672 [Pleurotus eryngii]
MAASRSSSPDPGSGSEHVSESEQTDTARLKRRNRDLEDQLYELQGTKKQKKQVLPSILSLIRLDKTKTVPSSRTGKTMGRIICRAIVLVPRINDYIADADRQVEGEADEEDIQDHDERDRRKCDRIAYQLLRKHIPELGKHLNDDIDVLYEFTAKLEFGASQGRSEDVFALKEAVADFINADLPTGNPRVGREDRVGRGFAHKVTGHLLCPIQYDWHDPEVRQKVQELHEAYPTHSSYFVNCLYKSNKGDPEHLEEGFLRNGLLVKVYLYIFFSHSSSAQLSISDIENDKNFATCQSKAKKATKKSVGQQLGLISVTPRTIAYAAVLLHFSLSPAKFWDLEFNDFSYEAFYNNIVDYLEDPGDDDEAVAEVKAVIDWWNRRVFPAGTGRGHGGPPPRMKDSIANQRAARRRVPLTQ